jgi:hypothetical protein
VPGRYFPDGHRQCFSYRAARGTVNPPWTSVQLYRSDQAQARHYLDLFGVTHAVRYVGSNEWSGSSPWVTLAFFDGYVLGEAAASARMMREGNISGTAAGVRAAASRRPDTGISRSSTGR